jgi:uridine kinase
MFLLGIAGGSGSGKTTFAKKIMQRVKASANELGCKDKDKDKDAGADPGACVALLHLDSYYLAAQPAHLKVHGKQNFDHPDAFDWELLCTHLKGLKSGAEIATPVYDFRTSRRTEETEVVPSCRVILMEGLYTLWNSAVRDLFDVKVYLHVDSDIRFIRRLHRDVRERGRTLDSIIQQYYDTVRPMHHEFLEPTRQYADLVVGEETDIAADVLAARVQQMLGQGSAGMSFSESLSSRAAAGARETLF